MCQTVYIKNYYRSIQFIWEDLIQTITQINEAIVHSYCLAERLDTPKIKIQLTNLNKNIIQLNIFIFFVQLLSGIKS